MPAMVALTIQRDVWFFGTSGKLCLYKVSHKNPGSLATLSVPGLRKLLASRGQETRNFRVTGSKALSCVRIDLRVCFLQNGVSAVEMQFEVIFLM